MPAVIVNVDDVPAATVVGFAEIVTVGAAPDVCEPEEPPPILFNEVPHPASSSVSGAIITRHTARQRNLELPSFDTVSPSGLRVAVLSSHSGASWRYIPTKTRMAN